MNTKCPQCGSPYNVTEAHIGRKFKCKNCSAALVVTENGVEFQSAAAPAATNKGAFDFDAGGGADRGRDRDEDKPRRPARTAARRDDDDDYEDDRPARPVRQRRSGGPNAFVEYLTFRRMIVPIIIQILFWLGVLVSILAGLFLMYQSLDAAAGFDPATGQVKRGFSFMGFLTGFGTLFLGPVVVRIQCELIVVLFSINSNLVDLKQLTRERNA